MAAEVETMFSARVKPWHGIGTVVAECLYSKEALKIAGLDWKVEQRDVFTDRGTLILQGSACLLGNPMIR